MRGDPLRMILKAEAPVHEPCQVRTVGQAVWHHQLVLQVQDTYIMLQVSNLIEKLVHVKVREGEGGAGKPLPVRRK